MLNISTTDFIRTNKRDSFSIIAIEISVLQTKSTCHLQEKEEKNLRKSLTTHKCYLLKTSRTV